MSFLGVGLQLLGTLGETASESVVESILSTAGLQVGRAAIRSLGVALPYIYSGVSTGLSANEIGRILNEAGIGYRRQNLLGIVRVLRTSYGYPETIPGGLAADYPSPDVFRFAFGRYQSTYNHIVTIHLRDPLTGEEDEATLTLASDKLLTLDEIDNMVMAYGPALEGSAKLGEDYVGYTETVGYTVDQVFVAP